MRSETEKSLPKTKKKAQHQRCHAFFLAEMKRFELLRRFEPTYRISSADPSASWVHLQNIKFQPVFSPACRYARMLEKQARKTKK